MHTIPTIDFKMRPFMRCTRPPGLPAGIAAR